MIQVLNEEIVASLWQNSIYGSFLQVFSRNPFFKLPLLCKEGKMGGRVSAQLEPVPFASPIN